MKLSLAFRFFFIFILFAGLFVLPISSDDISELTVEWIDSSGFPVNVVYYSAADAEGEPAGPVWVPDNARVYENGIEHRAFGFEDGEHAPAYISLIIDSSGSMEGSMKEVLLAAETLIDQFDRGDRAEILDFDSKIVPRQSFTRSKDDMKKALSDITVGGGTALYDAIAAGLDHLAKKAGMKAILVLSDGEDENSIAYDFPALKLRLLSEGVRVFAVALGKHVDAGTMNEIAELTGGSFYQAEQSADVGPIYSGIITYLHRLHRFWYSTSLGMFDGTEREVEFEQKSSGTGDSAVYQAPRADTWSHAIDYNFEHSPAPVKISPDGEYVSIIEYKALINSRGRRLTMSRWQELYDATMTQNYVCGYVHSAYGGLHRFDPGKKEYQAVERESILEGASGEYHEDWVWFPNGISPNEKYLIMTADPSDMKYDYYFLLFDREEKQVLWEQGFFNGDFDEPGPVLAADNGVSAIIQENILFVVEPDGSLRFRLNPKDTGRLWRALAVSGNGDLFLGRDTTGDSVWLYSGEGELLWEKPSDCHERGGYLAVSPNGKYLAYADNEGPHVVGPDGNGLFELPGDKKWYTPNCIDVADDGTIVYTLGNRIYYRSIQD